MSWLNVLIKEGESLRFGVLQISSPPDITLSETTTKKKGVGVECQFITEIQAKRQFLALLSSDRGTEGKLMIMIYIQGGCVYSRKIKGLEKEVKYVLNF